MVRRGACKAPSNKEVIDARASVTSVNDTQRMNTVFINQIAVHLSDVELIMK